MDVLIHGLISYVTELSNLADLYALCCTCKETVFILRSKLQLLATTLQIPYYQGMLCRTIRRLFRNKRYGVSLVIQIMSHILGLHKIPHRELFYRCTDEVGYILGTRDRDYVIRYFLDDDHKDMHTDMIELIIESNVNPLLHKLLYPKAIIYKCRRGDTDFMTYTTEIQSSNAICGYLAGGYIDQAKDLYDKYNYSFDLAHISIISKGGYLNCILYYLSILPDNVAVPHCPIAIDCCYCLDIRSVDVMRYYLDDCYGVESINLIATSVFCGNEYMTRFLCEIYKIRSKVIRPFHDLDIGYIIRNRTKIIRCGIIAKLYGYKFELGYENETIIHSILYDLVM